MKPFIIYNRQTKDGKPIKGKRFGVRTIGENGEVLNGSQGFTRKENAYKNIRATVRVSLALVGQIMTDEEIHQYVEDQTL